MSWKLGYHRLDGVLVKEGVLKEIAGFEGLILDIDGVLVDVRNSFRKAVIQTASLFCRKYIHPSLARKVSPSLIKKFKLLSGFNNDWELTYALILILILYFENIILKNKIGDFNSFAHNILKEANLKGGGLKGVQKVFSEQTKNSSRDWFSLIPFNSVVTTFQEIYGGKDFCYLLYGFKPKLIHKKGLVNQERPLVSKELLAKFYPNLGLITGRTKEETDLFLELSSFRSLFRDDAIVYDGKLTRKPHPAPLKHLIDFFGFEKAVYIGDIIDDWLMVERYCKIYQKRKVFGGIVVNSFKEASPFLEQNVDFLANSTESALNFLLKERGRYEKSKN